MQRRRKLNIIWIPADSDVTIKENHTSLKAVFGRRSLKQAVDIFRIKAAFCSLTGIHFISLGPWDRESAKHGEKSFCRGSAARTNWPLVQNTSPPLWRAEEMGLAGSGGRPRQGRLGGPMLRPPPCLWQTRQWIISPSGTRPGAVGLLYSTVQRNCLSLSSSHTLTLVCISISRPYTHFRPLITLTASINRLLHKKYSWQVQTTTDVSGKVCRALELG